MSGRSVRRVHAATLEAAGYLITKQNDFENYVLTVQWRWPEKGGNNGVLVHVTKPSELGVWPKSFEVQLQSGDAGELWVIGTTLQVEHPVALVPSTAQNLITGEKPLGQWNTMEITCARQRDKVDLNGYPVNRATKLSQQRGAIALQSDGTPIEFRKVSLPKPRQWPATRNRSDVRRRRPHALGEILVCNSAHAACSVVNYIS